jgi:hypothetical protein
MSGFSRLFLNHVPKAARVGVALGGGASAMALMYATMKQESKIAYCESPRYSPNKASLEHLSRSVWPFGHGDNQEWPGKDEIDLTNASKETIGRLVLQDEAQKLRKQLDLLAKLVEKWNNPSFGEWMEDDVGVDKIASELGELWKDFNDISDCRAFKVMPQDLSQADGDEVRNKDTQMLAQLVGLAYQCKGAICRIGELIGKDEIDANEMLQLQSDLHFVRSATKAIVPWLRLYEKLVDEELACMRREWLKLEEVQHETLTVKPTKQHTADEQIKWTEGGERLKKNKEEFEEGKRLKKMTLPQPERLPDESSSVANRRAQ